MEKKKAVVTQTLPAIALRGLVLFPKMVLHFDIGRDKSILALNSSLENGMPADFTIFDLYKKYTVDPLDFLSKGKATPFEGCEVFGECLMTVCNGEIAWKKGDK